MEIYFKKQPSELSERSRARAERNLQKLSRYVREGNYETRVEVEIVRESSAHTAPDEWKANINFDVAGDRFNSSARAKTTEKALALATAELKTELKQVKEKHTSATRRRAGIWELLQDGLNA